MNGSIPMNLLDPLEQLITSIGRSTVFPGRKYFIQKPKEFAEAIHKIQNIIPVHSRVEVGEDNLWS